MTPATFTLTWVQRDLLQQILAAEHQLAIKRCHPDYAKHVQALLAAITEPDTPDLKH